jgi:aspartate dehydrogenase
MAYTVAIAGLGAIGLRVARAIDEGTIPGITLTAVSARNLEGARAKIADFKSPPATVPLSELAKHADIVVECVPAAAFREVAEPVIDAGKWLLPLSVAGLLNHMDLVERARKSGGRIVVPTGALIGLDTVRAMATGKIHEVRLETRKPPAGLAGAPHLIENNISLDGLKEPLCVFRGTARQAAKAFPANVNVAAALGLAGIGPDHTQVEVWADPGVDRNHQSVTIRSDAGEARMTIANIPSAENPRTGRIVANSVIATLHRFTAPLTVGT